VRTGPILDWAIQYGGAAALWVLTEKAWYRLVSPAEKYAEMHQPDADRLAVCGAAVMEMQARMRCLQIIPH
jgi:hypothetical protein